jgi:hypothetical protein
MPRRTVHDDPPGRQQSERGWPSLLSSQHAGPAQPIPSSAAASRAVAVAAPSADPQFDRFDTSLAAYGSPGSAWHQMATSATGITGITVGPRARVSRAPRLVHCCPVSLIVRHGCCFYLRCLK